MSVVANSLLESKQAEAAITVQIPSVGMRTIIDKFTAYNSDATVVRTLTIYKVPPSGTGGATNILVVKALQPGETYVFPELVGHIVAPGGSIATLASAASLINIASSGRVVTA